MTVVIHTFYHDWCIILSLHVSRCNLQKIEGADSKRGGRTSEAGSLWNGVVFWY